VRGRGGVGWRWAGGRGHINGGLTSTQTRTYQHTHALRTYMQTQMYAHVGGKTETSLPSLATLPLHMHTHTRTHTHTHIPTPTPTPHTRTHTHLHCSLEISAIYPARTTRMWDVPPPFHTLVSTPLCTSIAPTRRPPPLFCHCTWEMILFRCVNVYVRMLFCVTSERERETHSRWYTRKC